MGLKINGSTSGSIEIDVPAVAGTDTAITIPATTGGEFIVSDASGNIDLGALDISGSASADSVNIDASGRLLVGTSTARTNFNTGGNTAEFQVEGVGKGSFMRNLNDQYGSDLFLTKSRSTGNSILSNNDIVGNISFQGNDGTNFVPTAIVSAQIDGTPGANDMPGRLVFSTTADGASSPTERLKIDKNGNLFSVQTYTATTAASANVIVESSGQLSRATSSGKYKTNIETLEDSYADALLNCRPVWYRSTCEGDNPEHGWWGFIAEEVAEIDPRLVFWKTVEVTYDEKGSAVETPCDPEPEGVAYDRFVPHLLNLIKRQKEQIESQATQLASLEARLTALEGGAS